MAQQAQNLSVEADECVTLTPDSARFKAVVQQYRPQSIAEVRKLLGPSAMPDTAPVRSSCCLPSELTANLPDPEALNAKDEATRYRARMQAAMAARAYVQAPDARELKYFEPVLDRYIALTRPILYAFLFGDIDIANGATLTLAKNAHILFAGNVRMHGSGRIVCKGPTTMRVNSINGRIPTLSVSTSAAASAVSMARDA
ncbi:hypothetical protein [Massilia sp. TS11]|uniref:hypothetical protein n=1 Tax=Massilia sp. TS11 TaxID=2908003 RepID=UPI001EDB16E5|nr:hypothetical protein [Massilia sp. TS11]MCG2586816.1 hypothetical protein [Massilia sp. TS11]